MWFRCLQAWGLELYCFLMHLEWTGSSAISNTVLGLTQNMNRIGGRPEYLAYGYPHPLDLRVTEFTQRSSTREHKVFTLKLHPDLKHIFRILPIAFYFLNQLIRQKSCNEFYHCPVQFPCSIDKRPWLRTNRTYSHTLSGNEEIFYR